MDSKLEHDWKVIQTYYGLAFLPPPFDPEVSLCMCSWGSPDSEDGEYVNSVLPQQGSAPLLIQLRQKTNSGSQYRSMGFHAFFDMAID